jgi:aspartyl-tRNA(Asn)/glutamyl-tRNA(Gln) amidotransferase subunit A
MNFASPSIETIHKLLDEKKTSIKSVVENALSAAEELNPRLNAFLEIDRPGSMTRATELESSPSEPRGKLLGIPIGIKDNICVRGMQTSCGSTILGSYRPPYDATAIERLKTAGSVIIGKTNCDEFAMGSSNENSAFGPARNPWDTERVPGGSSGGSAAAVAAGIVPVALGSDTGGSVRQPASLCGVVGIKPTYGRVSRYGLVAYGSSLDQIGVFARTVNDAATVLEVIAGRDPNDATTSDVAVQNYSAELSGNIKGARIGVPRALLGEGVERSVQAAIEKAIETYKELGGQIVDVELPNSKYAIATYYIIATAEASSNLARYDGVRYGFRAEESHTLKEMYKRTRDEGFGTEVKRRIMLGTFVLSSGYYDAYYLKAQQARSLIREDFRRALENCDAVLTPTSPTPAFLLGEKMNDPLSMYLSDIYTVTANLAGNPAISVPCGFSENGLPIGLQLVGKYWGESTILKLSHAFQMARPLNDWPKLRASRVMA